MLFEEICFIIWFIFNITSWLPRWLVGHKKLTYRPILFLHTILVQYRYTCFFVNTWIALYFWQLFPSGTGPILIGLMSYCFGQSKAHFRRKLKSYYRHPMYAAFLIVSLAQLKDMNNSHLWLMILYLAISFFTAAICAKFFLEKVGRTRDARFWFWELAVILSMLVISFALIFNFGYLNCQNFLYEYDKPIIPYQLATPQMPATDVQLNWIDLLYFSIATFTSTGYGDITPGTHAARLFASAEMICGYLIASILIAVFVSVLTNSKTDDDSDSSSSSSEKVAIVPKKEPESNATKATVDNPK